MHLSKLDDCPQCGKPLGQKEYDHQFCDDCKWPTVDSNVTVEKAEGLRYREERITVKTTWDDTENITQLVNAPSGVMQKRVLHTLERQAREALIALGWTPPKK